MTDYTYPVAVNFEDKDSLPSGSTAKIIQGSEFHDEFVLIATASATKADKDAPVFTSGITVNGALTLNGSLTMSGVLSTGTIDGGTY